MRKSILIKRSDSYLFLFDGCSGSNTPLEAATSQRCSWKFPKFQRKTHLCSCETLRTPISRNICKRLLLTPLQVIAFTVSSHILALKVAYDLCYSCSKTLIKWYYFCFKGFRNLHQFCLCRYIFETSVTSYI